MAVKEINLVLACPLMNQHSLQGKKLLLPLGFRRGAFVGKHFAHLGWIYRRHIKALGTGQ